MTETDQTAPAEPVDIADSPAPEAAPAADPRSTEDIIDSALAEFDTGDDYGAQPRGPDGKFAKKGDDESEPEAVAEEEPEEDAKAEGDRDEKQSVEDAPSRFSPDAKEAWKNAPAAVRGEVQRALSELENGIAQKDEALQPLKKYMDLAQQNGTSVPDVMEYYMNTADLLRRDPVSGVQQVLNEVGLNLDQFAQMAGLAGQQGGDAGLRQQIATMNQHIQSLTSQLQEKVSGVDTRLQDMTTQETVRHVQQFAAGKPRWAELEPVILRQLETGYAQTLEEAYANAERLNPAAAPDPAPQQAPNPAPAQTRQAKSITGAPNGGSNPTRKRPVSIEDSIDIGLSSVNI